MLITVTRHKRGTKSISDILNLTVPLEKVRNYVELDIPKTLDDAKSWSDGITGAQLDFLLAVLEKYENLGTFFADHSGRIISIFDDAKDKLDKDMQKTAPHEFDAMSVATQVIVALREAGATISLSGSEGGTVAQGIIGGIRWADSMADIITNFDRPEMAWFRKQARYFGQTPSDYATSNDLELWAETVAYAATRMKEVPAAVLSMMRRVVAGKTSESRQIIDHLKALLAA